MVVKALLEYAVANVANVANVTNQIWEFTTSQITEYVAKLAKEMDGDIDPEKVTSRRIGQVFRRMRLSKPPRPRGQTARIWKITQVDLVKWAVAYGIPIPSEIEPNNHHDTSQVIGNIGDIGNTTDNEFDLLRGSL